MSLTEVERVLRSTAHQRIINRRSQNATKRGNKEDSLISIQKKMTATKFKTEQKRTFHGKCFRCGRIGHKELDCKVPKPEGPAPNQRQLVKGAATIAFDENALVTKEDKPAYPKNMWIIDSGATSHMSGNSELFENLSNYEGTGFITVANGTELRIIGIGTVIIKITNSYGEVMNIPIVNVLYIPGLTCNLLSVHSIISRGHSVSLGQESFIELKCNKLRFGIEKIGKLYILNDIGYKQLEEHSYSAVVTRSDSRLGINVLDM